MQIEEWAYRDLGWAKIDVGRPARAGTAEAVYAAGKTPEQVVSTLEALREAHPRRVAVATRCDAACEAAVRKAFGDNVFAEAGVCAVGEFPSPEAGPLTIVCAGTSDLPIAREAAITAPRERDRRPLGRRRGRGRAAPAPRQAR